MRTSPQFQQPVAGFTLVELVVVIVILGILAAVAAPRFFNDRTFLQRGYYEELASALKYAQKLAVASGCAVRFEVSAAATRRASKPRRTVAAIVPTRAGPPTCNWPTGRCWQAARRSAWRPPRP